MPLLPNDFFRELYVRVTSTLLLTATLTGIGFLVAAYYFTLRDRQIHSAMTEVGLAIRATIAGVVGLGGFVFFLFINDGSLLP